MTHASEDTAITPDGRTLRWENRKPELLRAVTEHVLEAGIGDLTLRPLGAAIGVSNTTLIRQFGSKDNIIRSVCQEINGRMVRAFEAFWAESKGRPIGALRALWELLLTPEYQQQFVFFFELYGLALREPDRFEWFAESAVNDWRKPLEDALISDGLDHTGARHLSTLILATIRGLYLDLAATKDAERASDAYELALSLLETALGKH